MALSILDRIIDNFIRRIRDSGRKPLPIGPNKEDPTYWRWFVIPRNPVFNIYLHHWRHSDSQHCHDHRMFNISFALQGWYLEERFLWKPVEGKPLPYTGLTVLWGKRPRFRFASTAHRVVIPEGNEVWSLFIGFRHARDWGFWCPGDGLTGARWVPEDEYLKSKAGTGSAYSYDANTITGCGG